MRSCINCKYSHDVGPYLACYGQKNAPKVDRDDVCKDWKPEYTTNADRIRAMTDEELAEYLCCVENAESYVFDWLYWLKQEVNK